MGNQQRRCCANALDRQTERNETTTQAAVRALDKLKGERGVSSSLVITLSPFVQGLAGIIDVFINEHGVEAASDPAVEIAYRMLYAAVMRLEGGDSDIAARLDAGLAHGSGLFMADDILKEAGKAAKLRRRMQHKA